MSTSSFRLGYRPALDGLRAVAVLLVIGFHYQVPGFFFGFLGVDVFFVLSGFLITSILVEEWQRSRSISLPRFYLRRALRLFPALWVMLLILTPVERPANIAVTLLYGMNWANALQVLPLDPFLIHIWSLSVEEQFYLLWPLLLWFLLRRHLSWRALVAVPIVLALLSAVEGAALYTAGVWPERIYRGTDTHAAGLLIGCALALAVAHGWRLPRRLLPVAAVLPIAAFGYVAIPGALSATTLYAGGYLLIYAAITIDIYLAAVSPVPALVRVLSLRPLVLVGKISYGLYLWHVPVWAVAGLLGVPMPQRAILCAVVTLAITALSYRYLEQPLLRLKIRFEAARKSPLHVRA